MSPKLQLQVDERFKLYLLDPTNQALHNHPLVGKYQGYWSFNVNGGVRALYFRKSNSEIIFVFIGTHSQLYG